MSWFIDIVAGCTRYKHPLPPYYKSMMSLLHNKETGGTQSFKEYILWIANYWNHICIQFFMIVAFESTESIHER